MSDPIVIDITPRVVIRTPFDMRQFNLSNIGGATSVNLIDSDVDQQFPFYGIGDVTASDRIYINGPHPSTFFPAFFGSDIVEMGGALQSGTVTAFAYHTGGDFQDGITGFSLPVVDVAAAAATLGTADDLALLRRMLEPDNNVQLLTDGPLPPNGHYFFAGAGNDTVTGSSLGDTIRGDTGADRLLGGTGDDYLFGGGDGDRLFGQGGSDALSGGAGRDTMRGGAGNDELNGGGMGDRLLGGGGADFLSGNAGADTLRGAGGDDGLNGNAGADVLSGGLGKDSLDGGGGNDTLTGGAGADSFQFYRFQGTDRITDYQAGVDQIIIWIPGSESVELDFSFTQQGSDVRVQAEGVSIILADTQIADIDTDDILVQQLILVV